VDNGIPEFADARFKAVLWEGSVDSRTDERWGTGILPDHGDRVARHDLPAAFAQRLAKFSFATSLKSGIP
jgi:hypothetical protein